MLLRLEALEKQIGGRQLFKGVSVALQRGDRLGLVGPNGAGKTTLLRIIAGDESSDGGRIGAPKDLRMGMLRQEIDPTQEHSIHEEAARALAHLDQLEREMRALEARMSTAGDAGEAIPEALAESYDRASVAFAHAGGFERDARVAAVLAGLGFDEEARSRPLRSFSGGWLMRVELAKLLLSEPDLLLLDEPTNHLDLPAIQWFEEAIDEFRGAVVTVSHDRSFLRRNVLRVAELDGSGRFSLYEGNYDRYLEQRAERREQLVAQKANQDRDIAQKERFVERFRYKASKARQAQSRVKMLDRIDRIELPDSSSRRIRLRIPEPTRSGRTVAGLAAIRKAYGDKVVYDGVDLTLERGERLALVGPNGAGKSTLLRILAGVLPFDSGELQLGHNVEVAFYAQHQLESLRPELTVLQELEREATVADAPRLRGHLGAFLFSGDDVEKRISVLSGGEKARVALAKMLLHPANFLILDEPTNHLDIEACEVLEEALTAFKGTLAFVSHDRSFINALATRVIDVRDGELDEYLGNYDAYLEQSSLRAAQQQSDEVLSKASAAAKTVESVSNAELSPKQVRALERQRKKSGDQLRRKIAKLEQNLEEREAKLEALGWQLGDPENFKQPDRVRELNGARDALQSEIDSAYDEWERLSDELHALDAAAES